MALAWKFEFLFAFISLFFPYFLIFSFRVLLALISGYEPGYLLYSFFLWIRTEVQVRPSALDRLQREFIGIGVRHASITLGAVSKDCFYCFYAPERVWPLRPNTVRPLRLNTVFYGPWGPNKPAAPHLVVARSIRACPPLLHRLWLLPRRSALDASRAVSALLRRSSRFLSGCPSPARLAAALLVCPVAALHSPRRLLVRPRRAPSTSTRSLLHVVRHFHRKPRPWAALWAPSGTLLCFLLFLSFVLILLYRAQHRPSTLLWSTILGCRPSLLETIPQAGPEVSISKLPHSTRLPLARLPLPTSRPFLRPNRCWREVPRPLNWAARLPRRPRRIHNQSCRSPLPAPVLSWSQETLPPPAATLSAPSLKPPSLSANNSKNLEVTSALEARNATLRSTDFHDFLHVHVRLRLEINSLEPRIWPLKPAPHHRVVSAAATLLLQLLRPSVLHVRSLPHPFLTMRNSVLKLLIVKSSGLTTFSHRGATKSALPRLHWLTGTRPSSKPRYTLELKLSLTSSGKPITTICSRKQTSSGKYTTPTSTVSRKRAETCKRNSTRIEKRMLVSLIPRAQMPEGPDSSAAVSREINHLSRLAFYRRAPDSLSTRLLHSRRFAPRTRLHQPRAS